MKRLVPLHSVPSHVPNGWEGSASDSRVLLDAINRPSRLKGWFGMVSFDMQTGMDETEWDGTGRNGKGAKMLSNGKKEEEEGDREIIILCSMNVERVVPGGEAEQKFTQNSSRGTVRSTCFRSTKRGTERLVPLRSIPSHVPNSTYGIPNQKRHIKELLERIRGGDEAVRSGGGQSGESWSESDYERMNGSSNSRGETEKAMFAVCLIVIWTAHKSHVNKEAEGWLRKSYLMVKVATPTKMMNEPTQINENEDEADAETSSPFIASRSSNSSTKKRKRSVANDNDLAVTFKERLYESVDKLGKNERTFLSLDGAMKKSSVLILNEP
ncbi:hypothetical protein DVH24_020590 [Malus domestica]|uniref:Uncharacterized protein n=1 Tax=Malus domestica TaxID=3750 RepID=A0A498JA14_MALDO|nr:hypothetical protein DVH24_020590 [Malus domestica]